MIKNNIRKIDIIKNLSSKTGFSLSFSKKIINDLIDIISYEIKKNTLNLKNIGSFKIVEKKKREGRNPKTKEKFLISARRSITFTPSKKMSENINKFNG